MAAPSPESVSDIVSPPVSAIKCATSNSSMVPGAVKSTSLKNKMTRRKNASKVPHPSAKRYAAVELVNVCTNKDLCFLWYTGAVVVCCVFS